MKGAASIFPITPWTPYCMARRPVREVKQFRTVRVIYIYSWRDPANLVNHEVRSHEKWWMSVLIIFSMTVNFKTTPYMNCEFCGYLYLLSKTLRIWIRTNTLTKRDYVPFDKLVCWKVAVKFSKSWKYEAPASLSPARSEAVDLTVVRKR